MLEDSTKPNQLGGMCMEFLHFLVDKWPSATIKLTSAFLSDIGQGRPLRKRGVRARHGLPRAAGEVTEKNPLVLPPPADGTRGPCWLAIYETWEDLMGGYE